MRSAAGALLLSAVLASPLAAQDVVRLVRGGALSGEIVEVDDAGLRLRISLAGGAGSSVRVIPAAQIKAIDFAPLPGEAELLTAGEEAPKDELTALWAKKRKHLALPNSNAGEVGLQLGEVLLNSPDPKDHANARNLYSIIEGGDWEPKRRALARRGRLNAQVRLGAAVDVIAEARQIADESDDPEILLEAKHVLAIAEYRKLDALIGENPKWRQDDLVRPEVEALYHDLLDRFLHPFLFYGTEAAAAARGLWYAGETYRLIGEGARALECYTDLEKLYPAAAEHYGIAAARRKISDQNDEDTHPKE